MEPEQIRAAAYYLLESGMVVKVTALVWAKVYCEEFDKQSKEWVSQRTPLDVRQLVQECNRPDLIA